MVNTRTTVALGAASMLNLGCHSKTEKCTNFGPCLWHENKVFSKNELDHERELFMPFSEHPQLLLVGFVKHDWKLACRQVICINTFLSFKYKSPAGMPSANHS
jgi:hypothetical protein